MSLKGKKVLIFTAELYEDLELQYPKYRLKEEKAEVFIAGGKKDEIYKGKNGYPCKADISFDEIKVSEFDGLIIPGGYAPDKLRIIPKVIEITKEFHAQKKLIAFICHAGWVPISAHILKSVRCTSYKAIKDDMVNAGAIWVDEAVVVDQNFISSRHPEDLPFFCPSIINYLRA